VLVATTGSNDNQFFYYYYKLTQFAVSSREKRQKASWLTEFDSDDRAGIKYQANVFRKFDKNLRWSRVKIRTIQKYYPQNRIQLQSSTNNQSIDRNNLKAYCMVIQQNIHPQFKAWPKNTICGDARAFPSYVIYITKSNIASAFSPEQLE
jgi:hypothetical protein